MEPHDVTHFTRPGDFRAWLEEHHEVRDVLWVGFWKKATGLDSITWEESVDEALCFGWIDGLRKRVDEQAYTIRFTPRREGSTWSLRNVERFEVLDGEGRIRPAGRAAWERRVEERTGIYSFEQEQPAPLAPEFEERIRAEPGLWDDWAGRPPGYRKRLTHWIMSAKRPETRERRLASLLEGLRDGTA